MMMMNFNFVKKDHLLYLQAKILRPTLLGPIDGATFKFKEIK